MSGRILAECPAQEIEDISNWWKSAAIKKMLNILLSFNEQMEQANTEDILYWILSDSVERYDFYNHEAAEGEMRGKLYIKGLQSGVVCENNVREISI